MAKIVFVIRFSSGARSHGIVGRMRSSAMLLLLTAAIIAGVSGRKRQGIPGLIARVTGIDVSNVDVSNLQLGGGIDTSLLRPAIEQALRERPNHRPNTAGSFRNFRSTYRKRYGTAAETRLRGRRYDATRRFVEATNGRWVTGELNYTVAITEDADQGSLA
ncbi:PREDICTED: uncharacterized protein LOC106813970 [Priapulus caudatus]|uniref:Uncharacterized protein LOC106813970 n=1 Tax=Priapulus caudatus TaxID=37621 RepID=A0ABM1ENE1_PRICU|nr:PREDICTED: uncharacterized protein LOC106813970 [Priapulus caudatus]